jgi:Domain of unknown function (DUF5127)
MRRLVITNQPSGVRLSVGFFTPAFPQDIAIISRPATYLSWDATATDGNNIKSRFI